MNAKMKVLSLALIASFGYVGAAAAACPAGPTTAEGGAWSSSSVLGGSLAITTPGLDASECKLDASIVSTGFGSAYVRDETPASETRYRAKFIVDTSNLTGLNSLQSVRLLSANTETPYLSIGEAVRVSVFGNVSGTSQSLSIAAGCEGQPSNLCSTNIALSGPGVHTVQIDWQQAGSVSVWVDNTNEALPDATLTGNTAGWVVDYAVLGLSTPSPGFRTAQLNKVVSFDQFDSRRQTFID
jgi:hypothetical protein